MLSSFSITSTSTWKDHQNSLFFFLTFLHSLQFFFFPSLELPFSMVKSETFSLPVNVPPNLNGNYLIFWTSFLFNLKNPCSYKFSSTLTIIVGHSFCSSLTIYQYFLVFNFHIFNFRCYGSFSINNFPCKYPEFHFSIINRRIYLFLFLYPTIKY